MRNASLKFYHPRGHMNQGGGFLLRATEFLHQIPKIFVRFKRNQKEL
jgi:hypothetical protein